MQVLYMTVQKKLPLTPRECSQISRDCNVQIVALESLSTGFFYSVEFMEGSNNENVSTVLCQVADPV